MAEDFLFVGERLCLDFVNTELVEDGEPVDRLGGFPDLLRFALAARVLPAGDAAELSAGWTRAACERTFARALELRGALRSLAARLAAGRSAPEPALRAVNDALRARVGDLAVVRTKDGYDTVFLARWEGPEQLLVPIAESAAGLLSRGDPALVRKCENPDCVLYFYDTTRNHRRRWCSMAACGNRAKVAAHYRRTRAGRA